MEEIFAYEQLEVYKLARYYVKEVYVLSAKFPSKEDFALRHKYAERQFLIRLI